MRSQTSKLKLLPVTVLVLGLLTVTAFAALKLASNLAYAQSTVDFDFDTGSPPPSLYQSTPFNYTTSSGVIGRFSSPMDVPLHPAYSVQNDGTTQYTLSTFSGNYLWPSGAYRSPLEIKFSQPLANITFSFATMEQHGGPTGNPSFVYLTAYMDSTATTPIGTTSAQGTWPGEGTPPGDTYPQGMLTFNSSNPFNVVKIELPFQGTNAASSFLVDSIRITAADQVLDIVPPVTIIILSGTLGNQDWYKSDVKVSLSATDDMSGVNRIEYSYDNAVWSTYVTPFTLATEGTTTVYYRAVDNAGNIETAKSQQVKIDKVPPATTASLSGIVGNNGWYRSEVTVTLSAFDAVSGSATTEYSFDNTAWIVYTTPFTVNVEGTTTIYYKSTDNAGNVETANVQTIKVDKSSPTTVISLDGVMGNAGWYRSDVTVTLVASDSMSGVATTQYSFDNAIWKPYTAPFIVSDQGTNLVYYRSADVAGNAEPATTQTVKIDTTSPVTVISLSGVPGDVTITLSATDSVSGIAKTQYSFNNATWTDYTMPFTVNNPAVTTIFYRSTDIAGNEETVKTKAVTGDNTPPVTTISLSGILGNHGWYTSNVEVSVSATDDWSGVAKTEFSFDNVAWTAYYVSFSITNEGTTIVYYRSTDAIGNVEATLSQTVKIDKTIPTGSIVINGDAASTTSTSVTLTLTSNDPFSGVFQVRYSNDGTWDTEPWEAPSATRTWTLTAEYSTKTVYYQIMDNAGWTSATYLDSILLEAPSTIDTTKPVADAGPDQVVTEDTVVTFDGSASTDNIAIATFTWTFTDETSKTLTGMKPTYVFNTPGVYTITLKVTDAAGNWATDNVVIEVLDTTNPVANAGQDRTVNIGTPVSFSAEASSDNVGIVKYEWDCGDGTNHTGKTIIHTYNTTGTYTITLTVGDAAGNVAIHSIKVTVVEPSRFPLDATSQLWIILSVIAMGIGATATLLLKRRK